MKRLLLSVLTIATGAALLVAAALAGSPSRATAKAGGALRINLAVDIDFVDPALAYYAPSWQLEYATCLKLLNYPDREAPSGSRLVPEAATGFPKVSADGRSYTFTVRPGLQSNTGTPLTAANFAAAINRDLQPKLQSPAATFLKDIVGANAVLAGKATRVSGVKAEGQTLTIRLMQARPDFLARIAMPFACAIPTSLPVVPGGVNELESWGPYYVSKRIPKRTVELRRNPNYRGGRPHHVARISYTVGINPESTVLQIQRGAVDYAGDPLRAAAYSSLRARYGVNKSQFFVKPQLSVLFLTMNTRRPLFKDNPSLRRAVSYAIDRAALVRQLGALGAARTDQYLPPGMPGFKDAALYPLQGPDYKTAQRLAQGKTRDGKAVLYTCSRLECSNSAQILQSNLKQIGIDLEVKSFAFPVLFGALGTRDEPFDIGADGWGADYADPFDFINVLFDGTGIRETNNSDHSYFNDPRYNRKMKAAARLSGAARYAAYGRLDVDLAKNAAPLAAWGNLTARDFVSKRVKGYVFNPVYGMSLAAVSLN